MEEIKATITCPHCHTRVEYPRRSTPPLICPRCNESLQPMRVPRLFEQGGPSRSISSTVQPVPTANWRKPSDRTSSRPVVFLMMAVFILMDLGVVLFVVFMYLDEQNHYERLVSEGQTVNGTVTALDVSYDDDGDTYTVYYRFPALQNGQPTTIRGSQDVSSEFYDSLEEGQQIEVLYAFSDPSIYSIKAINEPPSILIPIIVSIGVLLSTVFMIIIISRRQIISDRLKKIR